MWRRPHGSKEVLPLAMRRRIWLAVLVLYLIAAVADGTARALEAVRRGEPMGPGVLAVAYCAGLFWPIDVVARPLLTPR